MVGGSNQVADKLPHPVQRICRIVNFALLLVVLAAAIIVLQKSFHFVRFAPALNVDDSIPNVAVSLAEHGRYGFLSSPTQGLYEVDRTHAFFNYGPLYFYVAAALVWLMGPSLELFRMLHPVGLVFIVACSVVIFRRISLIGTAILSISVFGMYLTTQWPVARPDIMVSVCAALMVVFAARGMESRNIRDWAAVGFFSVGAVTSHQIASALIPAAVIIWGWALMNERKEAGVGFRRHAFKSGVALVGGGSVAAVIYLLAIDFRLHDLWIFASFSRSARSTAYLESLRGHFYYAWSSLPRAYLWPLVIVFAGAAVVTIISAFFGSGPSNRQVTAAIMPPLVASTAYQLSIGLYGDHNSGYVILSQLMTFWTAAALVAVVISMARARLGKLGLWLELGTLVAAVVVVAGSDLFWLRHPSLWQERSLGHVDMNDYIREVLDPLPERAAVWGSLYFGLDAGDRTDLVQFLQMFNVVHNDFRPAQRSKIAPDYLALSSYETDIDSVQCIVGNQTMIENFGKLFPELHYRLVRLVYAPPYGVSRVYERAPEAEDAVLPTLAVNDGTGRQWSEALSQPLDVQFVPVAPVFTKVSLYAMKSERSALSSLRADLPPGFFLIQIALKPGHSTGFILATPGRYFYWRGGWTDFSMPASPYFHDEQNLLVLVDHLGGALYLSRFENEPANPDSVPDFGKSVFRSTKPNSQHAPAAALYNDDMRVVSIRRVTELEDRTGRLRPLALPPLREWTAQDAGISFLPGNAGSMHLAGFANPDAWLIESPPIPVRPHQRLVLSLPLEPAGGAVEAGVLGSDEWWLSYPSLMSHRIVFDTGTSKHIRIVLTNSGLGRGTPLDLTLMPGTLRPVAPELQYVDRVMGCRSYTRPGSADCGNK